MGYQLRVAALVDGIASVRVVFCGRGWFGFDRGEAGRRVVGRIIAGRRNPLDGALQGGCIDRFDQRIEGRQGDGNIERDGSAPWQPIWIEVNKDLNRREQRKRRKNGTSLFAPFRQRSCYSPEGTTLSQPRVEQT